PHPIWHGGCTWCTNTRRLRSLPTRDLDGGRLRPVSCRGRVRLLELAANSVAAAGAPVLHQVVVIAHWSPTGNDVDKPIRVPGLDQETLLLVGRRIQADGWIGNAHGTE